VTCEEARRLLSARMDGETTGTSGVRLDEHLAACAACREWREAAHAVTRRVRLEAAPDDDRAERITAAVVAARRTRRRGSATAARLGLAAIAAAQLCLVAAGLFTGGLADTGHAVHAAHELDAFTVGTAIGFLAVAARPARAFGAVSVVGAMAIGLVVTAGMDIVEGHTSVLHEGSHLLTVGGWLLLWWLCPPRRGGASAQPSRSACPTYDPRPGPPGTANTALDSWRRNRDRPSPWASFCWMGTKPDSGSACQATNSSPASGAPSER
jgi:predicted anti-sigma-YlaC factor YlaD